MRKETVERKKLKEKKKKQMEDISKDMKLDKKLSTAEKNKILLNKMYTKEEEIQEDTTVESKSRTRRISFNCKCGCEVNIESDNPKHFTKTTCYSCE